MKKTEKKWFDDGFSLPQPSASELRGRQSVRVTFKLSTKAIDAISILSTHLGIKQKSLFDHLLDDDKTLQLIAQEIQSTSRDLPKRIQKTFVISRKTLSCLEKISETFDTPRDALVEYSIQRLLPVIAKERERHLERKVVCDEYKEYLQEGEKLLKKAQNILGRDDPLYDHLAATLAFLLNAHQHMESFMEHGEKLADF